MKLWLTTAFRETEHVLPVVQAADRAGYDTVTIPDHLFYTPDTGTPYPYTDDGAPPFGPDTPWPDPWVLTAAMAATTQHIRFTTNIYVAPLRDLFTVAKLVSTAAVISGGRVALGTGAGWCRAEFEQTGQSFGDRGRRLDEMVDALRTIWRGGLVEHHGEHYDFGPLSMAPVPPPIPIYFGGESNAAISRAARIGDGWIGLQYRPDDVPDVVRRIRHARERAGTADTPFEVALALRARPSQELHERVEEMGVTALLTAPWMAASSLDDRITAVEQFAAVVGGRTA